MQFGVSPTPHPWWDNIKQLRNWLVEVERLDYNGVFIPNHHSMRKPMSSEVLDAWTTLSYFSAITDRIKLGTCVTPIPRYVPTQLAKVIANVDVLSNGRVIPSFGAGSIPDEFINYSPGGLDAAPVRVQKFFEGLQLILRLWTEEKVTFEGIHYKTKDAVLLPKPIQKPRPVIWSGGQKTHMLKITAKYFDGWIFPRIIPGYQNPLETYESRAKIIRKYAKEFGKDLANFTFAVLGSITDTAEMIEAYRQTGCQYYIVELFKGPGLSNQFPADQYISVVRKFAKEIIPSFT